MSGVVESWWLDIQERVASPEMSERQIAEMRMLFILGVWHMHDLTVQVASDRGPGSLAKGRELLESIAQELKTFGLEHYTAGSA